MGQKNNKTEANVIKLFTVLIKNLQACTTRLVTVVISHNCTIITRQKERS